MTTQTLRHAFMILPTFHKAESARPELTTSGQEPLLPTWEHHPVGRHGRETGGMSQDWIRTHLP